MKSIGEEWQERFDIVYSQDIKRRFQRFMIRVYLVSLIRGPLLIFRDDINFLYGVTLQKMSER